MGWGLGTCLIFVARDAGVPIVLDPVVFVSIFLILLIDLVVCTPVFSPRTVSNRKHCVQSLPGVLKRRIIQKIRMLHTIARIRVSTFS